MASRRKVVSLSLITALFIALVSLSLIKPDLNLPPIKKEKRPDFSFEKVKITQIEDGIRVWALTSTEATIDKSDKQTTLTDVKGIFYSDEQEVIHLTAPIAYLTHENSDIELEDSKIKFISDEGEIFLQAEELIWSDETKMFYGQKSITMTSGPVIVKGDKFKVDVINRKLELSENSKALIHDSIFQSK